MTPIRLLSLAVTIGISTFFLYGCGDSSPSVPSPPPDEASETSPEQVPENTPAPEAPSPAGPAPETQPLVHEKDGRKWIGDVPVDVWFDDPLAVASTGGEVTPAPPAELPMAANTTPEPETMPNPMPAETAGGVDWKRVISGELLDAEVTGIRNRLAGDLQTVGSYNSSYLGLPPHIATLAALSHIAEKHPDDIRWKENARYIKHLAGQMNSETLRRGASSQRPLKEKFNSIVDILSGSVPATLEVPEQESIQDVAKVPLIMKRLENASKYITVNGGTAEAMKSNADQLRQEAAVLGALTQVLLDGYEIYEGDDLFAGHVKNMVDATISLREHIKNEEFDKFELDVSKMNQACNQCHSDYR